MSRGARRGGARGEPRRDDAAAAGARVRFADAPDVETDLVARHGDRWVVVSVATSPQRAAAAGNALRTITRAWRRRTPVTGPRARPQGGARYLGATSQGEVIALDRSSRSSRSSTRYAFGFFPRVPDGHAPGR